MWIGSGCRGKFLCDGHDVTCGFSGLQYDGPRHACTCAPFHVGGTFLAGTGTPSLSLPPDLIDQTAPLHPRLEQARQGEPRFVPGSVNESLTATFAIWNLLDAAMHYCGFDFPATKGYHFPDLTLVGVIDVCWASAGTKGDEPAISVQQIPSSRFEPEPTVAAKIELHKRVLKALDVATLCTVPPGVRLSSKGIRLAQVRVVEQRALVTLRRPHFIRRLEEFLDTDLL